MVPQGNIYLLRGTYTNLRESTTFPGKIYGLYPAVLVLLNTEGMTPPSAPNANASNGMTFTLPIWVEGPRNSFHYRALMHQPRLLLPSNFELSVSDGVECWRVEKSYSQDLLNRMEEVIKDRFAFGAELQRLRIIPPQGNTGDGPVSHSMVDTHSMQSMLFKLRIPFVYISISSIYKRVIQPQIINDIFCRYHENTV